jgi:HSP20 family protein
MTKAKKDQTRPAGNGRDREGKADVGFQLGGVLGKFGDVLEKLADLAERGQELSQSGDLKFDPQGKVRGVYGFSVKTAMGNRGEQEIKVEPFGNIRREPSGKTVVEDVREPLVDVHEEDEYVLILAEIPGVSRKDVKLDLADDRLTISARRGEKRYHKEVALPGRYTPKDMRWDCANGILRIQLGEGIGSKDEG